MFEFFKTILSTQDFDLPKMLERISTVYASQRLTTDEYNQLIALANEKADPVAGLPPVEERLNIIIEELEGIKERLTALEEADAPTVDPEDPENPPEEDPLANIPEWKQPVGTIGMYMVGDQVKFDGKVYESVIDNNVWSPEGYPQGWQEIDFSTLAEDEENTATEE